MPHADKAPVEQDTKPGILNKDPDKVSLDNAVARLLREPEKDTPKKEPEPEQLEEQEDEGEGEESELESEGESEDEEEDDAGGDTHESEHSDNPEGTEEESEESEGEDESELVYTVKIDGDDYEVTADELKSGYQRQKDYTKKTQQLAEQRKDYESKLTELTVHQEEFVSQATMANELLNRDLKKFSKVDWDSLKETDPVGYVQKQIEMQDVQKAQAQLRDEAQKIFEHNRKVQQESHSQYLEAERKQMLEFFPDWKTPDKAQAHQGKIVEYAKGLGYSEEELAAVDNAKNLLVLDKARKYDELQKTKKGITKKARPAMRKLVKPKGKAPKGAAQRKVKAESRERLQKSGSIRDAAALMYEMRNSKAISKPK